MLLDGSLLHGFTDYQQVATDIGRLLFRTYWDELGDCRPERNHPRIYRQLLEEMGVDLPPTASWAFASSDRLDDRSFELPVYWLSIGRRPRTFTPEILGLNLAMELSGVGGSYRSARLALRRHGFSTRFVDIHNTIDNVAAGHTAWAADAVDTFIATIGDTHGRAAQLDAWERVRVGFVSLDPPSGRRHRLAQRRAQATGAPLHQATAVRTNERPVTTIESPGTLVLGLSAFYHDSAAALVADGVPVVAFQEERFSRRRHDPSFPRRAVAACLDYLGVSLDDVAAVAYYEDPRIKFRRILASYAAAGPSAGRSFGRTMAEWIPHKLRLARQIERDLAALGRGKVPPIVYRQHHHSHAASAFLPSPYESAAVLCVDGVGEWATTTIWHGRGTTLEPVAEIRFPHSLGLLYSAFTHFCGFKVDSGEYKLMGLAPYGRPIYADLIRQELIDVKPDGSFRLHVDNFEFLAGRQMTGPAFEQLFGVPRRPAESPLLDHHFDLAASVQAVTEDVMVRLAQHGQGGHRRAGPLPGRWRRPQLCGQRPAPARGRRRRPLDPAGCRGRRRGARRGHVGGRRAGRGPAARPGRAGRHVGVAARPRLERRADPRRPRPAPGRPTSSSTTTSSPRSSPTSWPTGRSSAGSRAGWSSDRGPSAPGPSSAIPATRRCSGR